MIHITVITPEKTEAITTEAGKCLLDILREHRCSVYAPCGGKGTCGKCRVTVRGEGTVLSCRTLSTHDIEVVLPGNNEASILVNQTEFLEDLPFDPGERHAFTAHPYGVAIDIGTSTVVLYFLNLLTGQIEHIASLINPQTLYGADVITRITYCQEHEHGLRVLQQAIVHAINGEIQKFMKTHDLSRENLERVIIAGNTTMLHLLLGVDPIPIALAPFTPAFTDKQLTTGEKAGFHTNAQAEVATLPCISAYVGGDIVAGLAALKSPHSHFLFLDIGTNGEIALIHNGKILTCAAAAGPAFEGTNISCGMSAVSGAISEFSDPQHYNVIGKTEPLGICGSGLVDIVAYMLIHGLLDESGLLQEPFVIHRQNTIQITQHDIREIQLAKSAIYSGMIILLQQAGISLNDIDALYVAGGFGNYIKIESAIQIGLFPHELRGRIFPIGNSAGIGALQYLTSPHFEEKITAVTSNARYIELSYLEEFTMEFAMNMIFARQHPGNRAL